jgi:arsenate reductase
MLRRVLRVYLKPTCSKCQDALALLEGRGIEFQAIDYYVEPLDEDRVRELVAKAGGGARALLRTTDRPELETSEHSDDELIALIAADPDLVLRPILELGERVLEARPPERALELLAVS